MVNIQASLKTSTTVPFGFIQVMAYEKEFRKDVVRGFPNVIASYPVSSVNFPVWFAEGTAQFQNNKSRHDYRDSHREMVLRDRFYHDKVLTYSAMGVFGKNSIGNESAYNQGFSFVKYIYETFGDSSLDKIVHANSEFKNWTFESAFRSATGKDVQKVYDDWVKARGGYYKRHLSKINENIVEGYAVEREGFANLFPRFSPDGKKVAYLTNRGSDYWSQNELILYEVGSGKKKTVTGRVASGISFSPDGRYLLYSKATRDNENDSKYNDLYIYDLKEDEEYRLTENMRARHPDWSSRNEIAFVIAQDGTVFLYKVKFSPSDLGREKKEYFVRIHGGEILSGKQLDGNPEYRGVKFLFSQKPKKLLDYIPGRQLYFPKWSPDGEAIVYASSLGYGRDIYIVDREGKEEKPFLLRKEDDRDPVFSPDGESIIYASDSSGIFNIYAKKIKDGKSQLLTNVRGGAFMPSAAGGQLVYSQYDSLGYKIYLLPETSPLSVANATYIEEYPREIPDARYRNSPELLTDGREYRSSFSKFQILPRIFIDYGTFKPGLYIMNSDPLDKWIFFAGAAMNFDLERDLNLYLAYNGFKPTIFAEFYNITQYLQDSVKIIRSDLGGHKVVLPQQLYFNLMRAAVGTEYTVGAMNYKLQLVYNRYDATVKNDEVRDLTENVLYEDIPLSYTYLKGPALEFSMSWDSRRQDRFTDIAPRGGRYVFFRVGHEWNKFLTDFKTSAINIENYTNYYFNRAELSWEEFFRVPLTKYHSLTLKFYGGGIDTPVDQFFHFYAGGLLGMRGYLYYSLGGRFVSTGQVSYKFPLFNDIDYDIVNLYFSRLYLNLFADIGNAWDNPEIPSLNDFKRDIGFEIRLDMTSFHMFPTRVFFSGAYPLDEFTFYEDKREIWIRYKKQPRFYFGLLFDFDMRERFGGKAWGIRPLSSY
jgi:Tol biopolymer transport system component